MRLALIGDIHFFQLRVPPLRLLGKRLLGQFNLLVSRRRAFKQSLLSPVLTRVANLQPDMALFSGDATTTSLEDEFERVRGFIAPLAQRVPVLMVPGNHDRYTIRSAKHKRVETAFAGLLPPVFPHFQKLATHWQLLALDAAQPRLFSAIGVLGPAQLDKIARHMATLTADDGLVILCHYPFAVPATVRQRPGHALEDRQALRDLMAKCPARIVFLHGHIHQPWHWRPDSDLHHVTDINAGSPTMTSGTYPFGQGFWQIDLPDDPRQPLSLCQHVPNARLHVPDVTSVADLAALATDKPATVGETVPAHDQAEGWDVIKVL